MYIPNDIDIGDHELNLQRRQKHVIPHQQPGDLQGTGGLPCSRVEEWSLLWQAFTVKRDRLAGNGWAM